MCAIFLIFKLKIVYKLYLNKQCIYSSSNREEYYTKRRELASSNWAKQIFGYNFDKV